MSTIKQRINITTDADLEVALRRSAKRDRVPVATKAAELIGLALDLEEDIALACIAEQRMARPFKAIAHDVAWK